MAQRSSAQRTLFTISILAAIAALFTLIAAVLVINTWRHAQTDAGTAVLIIGIMLLACATTGVLMGIFGVLASNDKYKIMPAWWFSIISLVIALATFVATFVTETHVVSLGSLVAPIIFPVLVLTAANTVKRQAGL